jgi:hypothetical protein
LIIDLLSFVITVFALEFWNTSPSEPQQENRVIDKELKKKAIKLEEGINVGHL